MGIALPQLAPASEDRVSGAQVIDGTLRFDDNSKQYLTQIIGSGTNGFTISCWMKPCQTGNRDEIFDTIASPGFYLYRHTNGEIKINNDSVNLFTSNGKYVDTTAFLNIVFSYDSTSSHGSLYVNGVLDKSAEFTTQLYAGNAKISSDASNDPANYYLGQWYLIDGLALGPGYFGYTDPLTNTWRPKKFKAEGTTVNDGTRWRNYLTTSNGGWHGDPYGLTAAFNGYVGSNSGGYAQAANGSANPNSVTFDVSSIGGIPFKNSVEVWLINNANTVSVNGGAPQSLAGTTFVTVARGPGVLNTIVFERPSTNGASLGTIRVDGVNLRDDLTQHLQFGAAGFYLPMDGNTFIGKNQAPSINDGTVWSSNLTSTQNFNLAVTRAFDGDTTTLAATANASNANILWTQTVTNVKTLRIYMDHDYQNYRVRVNGGSWHVDDTLGATQNSDWRDLTSLIPGNGTITSIESDTGGLNNGVNWSAVEINGDILIDSTTEKGNDWTPKNFGGSTIPEKATGARPILNTIGGTVARSGWFGSDVSATYTTTSASNVGGKYYFSHDASAQPTFSFIRGATYTFDWSASSGHPLRFATAADAAGSTEYTNGTDVTGNVTTITVPHDAPDTLYYYCNVHNGMGNSISVTTDETKADKYASSLVLACPFANDKEDISGDINCTVSNKGSDNYGSIQKYKIGAFYNSSRFFDGTDDNINYSSSSTLGLDGAFTVEMYATPSASNNGAPVGSKGYYSANTGNWYFRFSDASGGTISFYAYVGTSSGQEIGVTGTGRTNNDRMYHIVCQRDSSNLTTLLIDGVIVGQGSNLTHNLSDGATNGITVGRIAQSNSSNSGWAWHDGHISDLRIYKGIDKYDVSGKSTGDQVFIPASSNPDIVPDTPTGVAIKSKLKKITDGAVGFDGAGDYLSVAGPGTLAASSNWCMECFFYCTGNSSGTYRIMSANESAQSSEYLVMRIRLGQYQFSTDNANSGTINTAAFHKWTHMAFTKEGTTVRGFIDGKKIWETTDNNTDTVTNLITGYGYGSEYFPGHISNARFVNGSSVYTADFVPPSAPLTNITNTYLLGCQSNTEPAGAAVAPNVSGINNGTQWSHYLTGAGGFQGSYPASKAFNGTASASETSRSTNTGETQTFAPPVGIPYSSKVEVWTYYTGNVSLNGGSNVAVSDDQNWREIATGSGTLNTLDFICDPGNSMYLAGIRIDSTTILLDPLTPNGDPAATTFNPFNTTINTVRGQEGSYCTINPLSNSNLVLSNGNLTYDRANSADWESRTGTLPMTAGGKWYYEITLDNAETGNNNAIVEFGFATRFFHQYGNYLGTDTESWAYQNNGSTYGQVFHNNVQQTSYGSNAITGDTLALSLDLSQGGSNGILVFYKNGVSMGNAYTNIDCTKDYFPAFSAYYDGKATCNFGQKPFKFPPPDGFQPISASAVKPDTLPVINPEQYVKANIYTGNGASRSIDVGFRPDMVWLKDRTQATHNNNLIDSLNGAPNIIVPDNAGTTLITNTTDGLTAITDTGFDLGANTAGTQSYELNKAGNNYVAWTWRAGGAPTASNSATSGAMDANSVSIDGVLQSAYTPSGSPNKYPSKMSIGTKQGFSVVQWEDGPSSNKNIPHGLSEIPTFYIIKNVDAGDNYYIYTTNINGSLDFSANFGTGTYQDSARNLPTTSTVNYESASGGTHIMYCWHDVPGVHRSGYYRGSGSANGPFVDLGFRPAIILLKKNTNTDSNSGWHWYDNKRNLFNSANNFLLAGHAYYENRAANNTADVSSYTVDFLSNGFKLSHSSNNLNNNGEDYFYAAWAERPQFNLYGAQSNAR